MLWTLPDLVSLQLLSKLTNADRLRLIEEFSCLSDAQLAIGAMPMDASDALRIIDTCEKNDVCIISILDERYPHRLKRIDAPPPLLYVHGALPPEEKPCIAVVGTRSCTTQYGKPATEQSVQCWVASGCVVVSGLANGIDTIAHEACLKASGTTVAVIASGLGRITPIHAQRLSEQIRKSGGAVVSEHPFHVAALPPYFPARNRIISGMSDAVVVVESKATGGALITADFAIKQQRTLWAVPGPITSTRSIGTNALIKSGVAQIITHATDVTNMLGILPATEQTPRTLTQELAQLGGDPLHLDDAARMWGCSVHDALIRLFEYEMNGAVKQLPGSWYSVVR